MLDGSDGRIVSGVITSWDSNTRVLYDRAQRCTLAGHEILEECLAIGTDVSPTATGGPYIDEAWHHAGRLGHRLREDVEASCPAE